MKANLGEKLQYTIMFDTIENCIIVGYNSFSVYSNCLLVGDELVARCEGDFQVGDTLFGKPLPDELEMALQDYGDCIQETLKIILSEFYARVR